MDILYVYVVIDGIERKLRFPQIISVPIQSREDFIKLRPSFLQRRLRVIKTPTLLCKAACLRVQRLLLRLQL